MPANTSTVVHACTAHSPSGRLLPEPREVGANSPRPRRSSRAHYGSAAPPGASPEPRYRYSLSGFLSPPFPRSFSRSPSGRVFLLPCTPSPGLPLRHTCSQRRSRMQWGALRARASRPPQQPPGLAGSRMLRPPRAPLPVPRCPHRPHGGRLSQPEALQKGSTRAEKRDREAGSAPRAREAGLGVGGRLQSAMLTAPLCARGARPERES